MFSKYSLIFKVGLSNISLRLVYLMKENLTM